MKKLVVAILLLSAVSGMAQEKEIKPSVAKAEKALLEGKVDQAKTIIDATVGNQEYMVDKKGNPSRNAAKAWYLRGLIYAAIDTSKNKAFNALDTDPLPKVTESLAKANEIDPKALTLVNDKLGLPLMKNDVAVRLANSFYQRAVKEYQDNKDFKTAFKYTKSVIAVYPDTVFLNMGGVFFAPQAEEYDQAIDWIAEYHKKGGKSSDAYVMLYSIYRDRKKEMDKALAVAKEAQVKFPANSDFPKYELDIYFKTGKMEEAKVALEKQITADPSVKETKYYLGLVHSEMKDFENAKKWFGEAVKLDGTYYDARIALAETVYNEAKLIRMERDKLGISDADVKKRSELFKSMQKKEEEALPYWEACEKLQPNEEKVLYTLLTLYSDLVMDDKANQIKKKLKALGLDE
ncbi:MAG: hypothetical protein K1X47_07750 [Cyclobacteriaceae bacterium]|nr:hypothetical protein [Cyclobacteriaceae bacterium]